MFATTTRTTFALIAIALFLATGQLATAQTPDDGSKALLQQEFDDAQNQLNQFVGIVDTSEADLEAIRSNLERIRPMIRSGRFDRNEVMELTGLRDDVLFVERQLEFISSEIPVLRKTFLKIAIEAKHAGMLALYNEALDAAEAVDALNRDVQLALEETKAVKGEVVDLLRLARQEPR